MFQFYICFAIGRTFISCRKYKEIKNNILSCIKGMQKNNMITRLALVTTKSNSLLLAKAKKRKEAT